MAQVNTRSTRYGEGGGSRRLETSEQPVFDTPVVAHISRSPNGRLQIQLPDTATTQARVQPSSSMANVQDLVDAIALLTAQFRDQQAQQNTNNAAVQQQLQQALIATNDLAAQTNRQMSSWQEWWHWRQRNDRTMARGFRSRYDD
ncbi:hypothetical protein OUZ56_026618 [Daphnia magna]|uniref:Uncharacterized protein n=1 Tax=Daphnia magna TaxID=35525 RepID=A0ABQ9ZMB5_9CRUS|nr:hypothetical protein OUZ56_026618 [Daphnia magna]